MQFYGAYKVIKDDEDNLRWQGGCYGDKDQETLEIGTLLDIAGRIEGMTVLIEVPE